MDNPNKEIKLALPGPWLTLDPGLQHTLWGGLALSNQFDPLVGFDETGVVAPLGAKSWSVSDDFRTFTFQIDGSKRFSDGAYLTAQDYKRSWEDALKLTPMSANSSLGDVLYSVEGFSDFPKTGHISGIRVNGDHELALKFTRPVRMALAHLAGTRFGAVKKVGDAMLGTGKYVIHSISENELLLSPNPFVEGFKEISSIRLSVVLPGQIAKALEQGRIDGVAYIGGNDIPDSVIKDPNIEIIVGQEALHRVVLVNGNADRLLSVPHLRLAIQSILLRSLRENPSLLKNAPMLATVDPQIYLPIQPGRLTESEAQAIIGEGKKYIDELINETKKRPLVVFSKADGVWLAEELRRQGLEVSSLSRIVTQEEAFTVAYKSSNFDLFLGAFSIDDGDPDGVYHAFGKHGAILMPYTYREKLGQLLEEGKEILGQSALDAHYKKVSRSALEEVPVVHLGFVKAAALIRKDRLEVADFSLRRNEGHMDVFRLK